MGKLHSTFAKQRFADTTRMPKKAKKRSRKTAESSRAMPLYHQSYLVIRQRLLEGVYPPEKPLPSEEDMRHEFNVSRVTIRRALAELESEGLIQRRRGSGTYPIEQSGSPESRANISGLYENLITLGLKTEAKLLTFETIPAPRSLQRVDSSFEGEVLHIRRVRLLNKEPYSLLESFIPGHLADHFRKRSLGNQPLLVTLDLAGIEATSAEQALTAVPADAEAAEILSVPVGAPLIQMNRLSRGKDQTPIEYFTSYYRPDRFEYRMTLSRVRGGEAPHWKPLA